MRHAGRKRERGLAPVGRGHPQQPQRGLAPAHPRQRLGADNRLGIGALRAQPVGRARRRRREPLIGFADARIDRRIVRRLRRHQLRVRAVRRQQRGVVAALHQPTLVEHQNLVAGHHARKPVRHDQRRAPRHQALQRLLNRRLVFGVHAGQRLIEDQNRRVAQQRAGDRDPLPLAARKPMPPLADHRLVALRQVGDELVRVGRARRRDDLLVRRLGIAEAQIVQHRAVEQVGVLHHHRHPAADLREAQRVELAPAQPNSPLLRHVDPLQQPEQRRLARARAPHHAHAPPRRRAEAHLAQRVPPPRRVGERDRVELQLRAQLIGARVRRRVGHLRLRVGHFQHALRGRHAE